MFPWSFESHPIVPKYPPDTAMFSWNIESHPIIIEHLQRIQVDTVPRVDTTVAINRQAWGGRHPSPPFPLDILVEEVQISTVLPACPKGQDLAQTRDDMMCEVKGGTLKNLKILYNIFGSVLVLSLVLWAYHPSVAANRISQQMIFSQFVLSFVLNYVPKNCTNEVRTKIVPFI